MLYSGIRSAWHYNIFLATYKPVSLLVWTLCDGPIAQYCIAPQINTSEFCQYHIPKFLTGTLRLSQKKFISLILH